MAPSTELGWHTVILRFFFFLIIMAPSTELGWHLVILRFFFYGTLNGVGVTYCYSSILFFLILLPHILSTQFLGIELTNVDGSIPQCAPACEVVHLTLEWSKWLPFPWKQQKSENIQSVPNCTKLHLNSNRHGLRCILILEFSKWLPLPWKQLKYQKF